VPTQETSDEITWDAINTPASTTRDSHDPIVSGSLPQTAPPSSHAPLNGSSSQRVLELISLHQITLDHRDHPIDPTRYITELEAFGEEHFARRLVVKIEDFFELSQRYELALEERIQDVKQRCDFLECPRYERPNIYPLDTRDWICEVEQYETTKINYPAWPGEYVQSYALVYLSQSFGRLHYTPPTDLCPDAIPSAAILLISLHEERREQLPRSPWTLLPATDAMWDLRAVLEGLQTALGAVSFLCLVVMTKFKQAEARRRKRRPFIAVLGIILLVLFADIYILFDSTGWMPGSLPLTAALLYMLAVILQIDHLCPSTDKEKNTEPTWCAYFGSWAAMFVFDMVAIVKLALTSRSWPPDLVCAGVRCCFELVLLVLSVRPYIKPPGDWRKWFRNERIRIPDDDDEFPDDDERIQLPEDDQNGTMGTGDSNNQEGGSSGSTEQIKLRQSVSDQINAAGGFWPWLKKFRIFLQWIWPSDAPLTKLRIFASLGLLLANTVLGLYFPRLFGAFVEGLARSYADKEFSQVFQPLWRYLVANVASTTIQRLFNLLQNEVGIDRQRLASESIYQHLMGHDASFHLQINPTDTNTAFDDGIKACSTFDFLLLEVLPQIITVIGAEIIILSFFGLQVGLVQGTIVAIDTIFILRKMRVQMPMHDSRTAARQETKRRREGGLKAWLTALFCGQVDREIDDYITLLAKEIWIELKSLYSSFIFSFGSDIVITAGTFLAIGLAIKHGIQTGGTFGPVVMFVNYWWLVQGPLKSFMEIPKHLSEELYTADRLRRLLEIKPKMQYGSAVLQSTEGGVRLNNISFSYTDASGKVKRVFKSLTLSIRPGETVAFVGPSGVGKSTIFSLITRLYDPVEGTVEIDGQDIRTL
ncbi:hypothetical protein CDV31_016645, partial [Fusarium ambrosium]